MADKMRIGILSDTHGSAKAYQAALMAMGEVDLIMHAGDHVADAHIMAKRTGILTYAVSGNCDYTGDDEIVLTLCGSRVLMVHGHDHSIKRSLDKLASYVEQREANVCIFGHSHVPLTQKIGQCLFINPGSPYRPRLGIPTCAVLTLQSGKPPCAEIISIHPN